MPLGYRVRPFEERLWSKIDRGKDHWLWTGANDGRGYGHLQRGGSDGGLVKAHRAVYELLVGPIPDGLELDHLCRVPSCVRPDHLEPVTHALNMRRGIAARSVCRRGHPWTPENTSIVPGRGTRLCRTCSRDRWNRATPKKKARRLAMRLARAAA